jgi:hypothetical protein
MRWRTANNRRRRLTIEQIDRKREAFEDKVYEEQIRIIDQRYGDDTNCNLGWGVTGDENHIDIATKVYVEGRPILRSVGNYKTGKILHEWC